MRATLLLVVAATMAISAPASAGVVAVIDHDRLRPAELTTALMQPVLFVNRSSRPVDVKFAGAGGQQHVLRLNGTARAVVFPPGRHPFVARFAEEPRHHLHGAVTVRRAPDGAPGPPICGRVPPTNICIEP